MDLIELLSTNFPDDLPDHSCRNSLLSLKEMVQYHWESYKVEKSSLPQLLRNDGQALSTTEGIDPDKVEQKWQLCSTPWVDYAQGWHTCSGTWTRGYTCGLWSLLHAVAATSNDGRAASDLAAARAAVSEFFGCEVCRQHFETIPVSETDGQNKAAAQLWWWKAHNIVNARVEEIEADAGDWDPAFPKIQWPSDEICESCRDSTASSNVMVREDKVAGDIQWHDEEVASFLSRFYR